jgi:hypothetical protein
MLLATLAVAAIALCLTVLFVVSKKPQETFRGPEFDLRPLATPELAELSRNALNGVCSAAYKVARYHMYFSLDMERAILFFRLATKCPNANAYASLITLLNSKPDFDSEVDRALSELRKIDPRKGDAALVEITVRRNARAQK